MNTLIVLGGILLMAICGTLFIRYREQKTAQRETK
jgi:LPXTG-motif cell wall-anchored protein